jgi:hypothetical protein
MAKPIANAGADITLDLDGVFTLGNNQQLNNVGGVAGAITEFGDGSSIPSDGFKWYLLEGPSGHGASLIDSTIQQPVLQNIDTWGNYRLMLVVTNNVGTKSEEDPLLAPDSAFMTVRLISASLDLEKPARGERNWEGAYHTAIAGLETLHSNFHNTSGYHKIEFHDTTATGAELDILTGAGYATADSTATGTKLHKHAGPHVDEATVDGVTQGVVKLAGSTKDPYQPGYVWGSQTIHMNGTTNGSYQGKINDDGSYTWSWNPNHILDAQDNISNGLPSSPAHLVFTCAEDAILREANVHLNNSGFVKTGSAPNDWQFQFRVMSQAKFIQNLWHVPTDANYITPSFTVTFQSLAHKPNFGVTIGQSIAVEMRQVIVVTAYRDPYTVAPDVNSPGSGLNVSILLTRGTS